MFMVQRLAYSQHCSTLGVLQLCMHGVLHSRNVSAWHCGYATRHACNIAVHCIAVISLHYCVVRCSTVNSLCKDTRCKDNLNVRTTPLITNHCILTAVAPLSKDNLM